MQEVNARAALVAAPGPGGGLTTSLPRDEVEEALRAAQEAPQLVLDVTRFADGEAAETRSITVAWEKGDLEELLRQATGERVTLTFDRDALEQAMEADVEAHGIREKVLVLAVAATAAAGAAGAAAAHPVGVPTSGGQAVEAVVVSPDDRGLSRASPVVGADTAVSPDDRAVSRASPVSAAETTGSSPDDRAVSRTFPAPDTGVGVDDRAVSRAAPVPVGDTGGGISPDDRALPRTAPAPAPSGVETVSDSGFSISAPSPAEAAAIGGAIALAITGAGFVVAGRRRGRLA